MPETPAVGTTVVHPHGPIDPPLPGDYVVTYSPEEGWVAKRAGSTSVAVRYPTLQAAVDRCKKLAYPEHVNVIWYGRDGVYQGRSHYRRHWENYPRLSWRERRRARKAARTRAMKST